MTRLRPSLAFLAIVAASGEAAAADVPQSFFVLLEGPSLIEALPAGVGVTSPSGRRIIARRASELAQSHAHLRPKLEAAGATVTADLTRVLNAFQVVATAEQLRSIARLPGVAGTELALVVELNLTQALPALGIPALWQAASPLTGTGLRVGIIDSGVDYTHATFGGAGDPAVYKSNDRTLIEPGSFPTLRVVGGTDLAGDDYDPLDPTQNKPSPDPDPLDCQGHGTHVASIAAGGGITAGGLPFGGSYAQSFDPAGFKLPPGVAPTAALYAIKIFGCKPGGTTALITSALEWATDPNGDSDLSDRLDVINLSVGSAYSSPGASTQTAFANATKAGVVCVVAAGNAGDSFFSLNSNASVGSTLAVTNSTLPMQTKVLRVMSPPSLAGDYPTREATLAPPLSGTIEGPVVIADPPDACASSLSNAAEASGKLLLVVRGSCGNEAKVATAQAAGPKVVLVVDTEQADLPLQLTTGTSFKASVPVLSLRRVTGEALLAEPSGSVVLRLDPSLSMQIPGDGVAEFSSRAPASGGVAKPDLAAPGFAVLGAAFGSGNATLTSAGTSLSAPFVAGAAALLRQARPTLDPATIAALLVNSAAPMKSLEGKPYSVGRVGAGRLDVTAALDQQVSVRAAAPNAGVGVLFEKSVVAEPVTRTAQAVLKNHGTTQVALSASAKLHYAWPGLGIDVQPAQLTLAAGAEASVTLSLAVDPQKLGAPPPDDVTPRTTKDGLLRQYLTEATGLVTFADGKHSVVLPFQGVVRAAAHRSAQVPAGCESGDVSIPLTGDSATPNPVAGVFQSTPDVGEIRGLATDLDSVAKPEDASLFVLVANTPDVPSRTVFFDTDLDTVDDYTVFVDRVPAFAQKRDTDAYVAQVRDLAAKANLSGPMPYVSLAEDGLHDDFFYNEAVVLQARLADLKLALDQKFTIRTTPQQLWSGTASEIAVRLPKDRHAASKAGGDAAAFRLSPGVTSADLLVFHSTNVQGERIQSVSLDPTLLETGKLAVSVAAPESVAASANATVTVDVENDSTGQRRGVKLTGSASAGTVTSVTSSAGSCTATPFACDLGDLAAGATVTLTIALEAPESGSIDLDVSATSARGCEAIAGGNSASVSMVVDAAPKPAGESDDDSGCGCRTAGVPEPRSLALLALTLALTWARRRGRARAAPPRDSTRR